MDPSSIAAATGIAKYLSSIPAEVWAKFKADDSIKAALRYLEAQNYDLAVSCLDTAIEKNKSDDEVRSMLYITKGIALNGQGFAIYSEISDRIASGKTDMTGLDPNNYISKALLEFDNAKKINPLNPLLWYHKGVTHLLLHQSREAIQSFDNALALDSVSKQLRISLLEMKVAALAMMPQEQDKVLAINREILELDPSNENARILTDLYEDPVKAREKWFGK